MPWFLPFRKLFLNINVHNDNIIKKKKKKIYVKKKKNIYIYYKCILYIIYYFLNYMFSISFKRNAGNLKAAEWFS
ncbi:hypothetical protein PFFVO_03219 [Plasmodium falciparum Vietnam Oak-Knoll (FVO)]|uniref:Uncharacterized protein n=1 Tax=Plasmodium falciparum Vietnam Oak-Knoll (FVO) TaxID=1036723 RepID=A0A024V4D7_PLAFA|nr:hypothetical protein PFFVO_03219 [Plasmodium falciparum Vietnam Oak-Knoll (FVO)]